MGVNAKGFAKFLNSVFVFSKHQICGPPTLIGTGVIRLKLNILVQLFNGRIKELRVTSGEFRPRGITRTDRTVNGRV